MRLKSIELVGFKSFARKTSLDFGVTITAIVGPNGSGKSNIAEAFRFVLGEQSMKSMRGRRGEDMIWNGSGGVPRSGRASVKLIFDNYDRAFNLDFDEVSIERVVHRDGISEYLLNSSVVRLRDIVELLSQANIGASGHHIISQGEADRILSASSRERREMLEDALGLTAYLYKREDAERKLEKTAENMREVEMLRRELAPHLRFLHGQVKKIEEVSRLQTEISQKYLEYLGRESIYLRVAQEQLEEKRAAPQGERKVLEVRITQLRTEIGNKSKNDNVASKLVVLEEESRTMTQKREQVTRRLGRIEGEEALRERMVKEVGVIIPHAQVEEFVRHVEQELKESLTLDVSLLHARITALLTRTKEFLGRLMHTTSEQHIEQDHARKAEIEQELHDLQGKEKDITAAIVKLRTGMESERETSREIERELFSGMARRSELESILVQLSAQEQILAKERETFRLEFAEAGALIGSDAAGFDSYPLTNTHGEKLTVTEIFTEDRALQQERRRKLERLKIRLEEIGMGNTKEILQEYKETSTREEFLAREIKDLEVSARKLYQLVEELTATLQTRFVAGIETINIEFNIFFKLMFGGGSATLSIVHEEKSRRSIALESVSEKNETTDEVEEGIDIAITLPHKRIKGLHMLSGGERALTSIALIFAMSQVNPPPFLILDETDAALDEANSRRYGDMIENLAQKSQLILITHNRETMSRAGVLYGITMNSDGISKLLSVHFEEALVVAK